MMGRVILYRSIREISGSVTRLAVKVSIVILVAYSPSFPSFFYQHRNIHAIANVISRNGIPITIPVTPGNSSHNTGTNPVNIAARLSTK